MVAKSTIIRALLVVGLSLLLLEESDAASNKYINRYHHYQFDTNVDYVKKIAIRAAAIFAIAILALLIFFFWSCCRCCNCCKPPENIGGRWKGFYTILLLAVGTTAVVFILFGFAASKDQNSLFDEIMDDIDAVVAWKDDIDSQLGVISDDIDAINAKCTEIVAANAGDCGSINSGVNDIGSTSTSMHSEMDDVSDTADGQDFGSIKSSFSDKADNVNKMRKLAVLITLIVLISVVGMQIVIALLNAFAADGCKPSQCGCFKCLTFFFTIITIILIFVVWMVSGTLFIASSFFADFCVDPDGNILRTTGLDDNDIAVYYFTCDTNANQTNPFNSTVATFQDKLDDVSAAVVTVQGAYGSCSNTIKTKVDELYDLVDTLKTDVGKDTNGDTDPDTGLFYYLSCAGVNTNYENFIDTMCDSFMPSLAKFFEVFLAMACCLIIAEFCKRKLEVRARSTKVAAARNSQLPQYSEKAPMPNPATWTAQPSWNDPNYHSGYVAAPPPIYSNFGPQTVQPSYGYAQSHV